MQVRTLSFWLLGRAEKSGISAMGERAKPKRHLSEAYKYPGFRPRATIREVEGDAGTLIVRLERRSKNPLRQLRPSLSELV